MAILSSKLRSLTLHRTTRVPYGARRRDIIAFLNKTRPDVILAEFGNVAMRIAPVANQLGLPIFCYFRGADASSQLRMPLRAAAYRRMMPRLDGVFSVSQFLLDELADNGASHPNSHVVPSGVNTDLFMPGTKKPGSILAVGRLIEKKRPDITLRAFCETAKQVPDITLDVVGDGPMRETCEEIARAYDMCDRITFHGAKPHGYVKSMLAQSEVFVQHSVRAKNGSTEGLPTAIQEAMSCGMAIVSTRHAGIPEAVTEAVNGYLVPEGDVDGYQRAILRLAVDRQLVRAMATTNRQKAVDCYDNRKLIKIVEREIITAANERRQLIAQRRPG